MSTSHSAGLLAFRRTDQLEVFLVHMGGPFWSRRQNGAWSIPKGEYDAAVEDPVAVAKREFAEETGLTAPVGDLIDLGECRQPSGKHIRTYAVATDEPLAFIRSNTFSMEWPRGSGVVREFPEVDDAAWFDLAAAEQKLVPGQVPILAALAAHLTSDR